MNSNVKQWILGIVGVVAFIYGLKLFGDAFRAYTAPFATIWAAIPISACFLYRQNVLASFTLSGLRRAQIALMVVVVALSFAMFACRDHVRNKFGRHYVQGYNYWRGETDVDELGQPYYVGDEWTATTPMGQRVVTLF
ncbi:MAG: hypothetical protein NTY53_04690, partial [Kiritimatiellaeota bacterium]|nr:hypothetical protein [Kiritimatiellota bacterium]